MRLISFNQELTFANVCFSQLFRNITINRKSPETDEIEPIKVMCVIGSRARIIKALENQQEKADFTLPLISIMRTGIRRDSARLANLHNEIKNMVGGRINYNMMAPNPLDILYKVTIFAKYQSDIDLILSNWIPFFNNDVWVSVKHYKYIDLKFNSQIVMDDSISETRNESPTNGNYDFCQAECNFTFKTVLFGGNQKVYSGLHPIAPQPVTMITTVIDPDTGEDISTIITAQPDPNTTPEISAEGFLPVIQNMVFDFHAVPRVDPYVWDKYRVVRYLDIDRYFEEVLTGFITHPDYDSIDWMFTDMSADLKKNKEFYDSQRQRSKYYHYEYEKGAVMKGDRWS